MNGSRPWSRGEKTPNAVLAGAVAALVFGIAMLLWAGSSDSTGALVVGIAFIALAVWEGYNYLDSRSSSRDR